MKIHLIRLILCFYVVLLTMTSCGNGRSGPKADLSQKTEVEADVKSDRTYRIVANEPDSMLVDVNFRDGHANLVLEKKERQIIYIRFDVDSPGELHADVEVIDTAANIRFSQIVKPDNQTDGPFGKSVEYDLSETGIYMILLHENMMAGDPWKGKVNINMDIR